MDLQVVYNNNSVSTNFEDLKEAVKKEVEKYSIDVKEDNISEAKTVMANLNKVKTEIGNKYKHHISTLSLPIDKLKSEMKELERIITQGRQEIADGVAKFENEKLKLVEEALCAYRDKVCEEKEINAGLVSIVEFIKLTAITQNGNISKASKDSIDAKVSLVENEILKAKIEAEEKAKRDREIAEQARREAEERAREREEQIRKQAEVDKAKAVEEAKREAKKEVADIPENHTVVEKVAPKEDGDGKMIYTVLATFEVKAPKGISNEKIINALQIKLVDAGITTCKNIKVM